MQKKQVFMTTRLLAASELSGSDRDAGQHDARINRGDISANSVPLKTKAPWTSSARDTCRRLQASPAKWAVTGLAAGPEPITIRSQCDD